jgi:hypothetical protein
MGLKHANPDTYTSDLQEALDEFEKALLWRYEVDCEDRTQIWTTHGFEPEHPGDAGSTNKSRAAFENIEEHLSGWAAEVRDLARQEIVDYSPQDLNKLESAFEALNSVAVLLGQDGAGKTKGIPKLAIEINGKCDVGWAGASGEAFRHNFGTSATPTLWNQADIAASLTNLYSARTSIIEAVRRNTINAFKRATKALRETEDSGEENDLWFVIGMAGTAVGLVVTAGAGVVISVVSGIVGYIDGTNPDQIFANEIVWIVVRLLNELRQAGSDASSEERSLFEKLVKLQEDIEGAKSKELELYDFTEGEYSPAAPEGGFDVSADFVYKLSALCFEASWAYEEVIAKVVSTDAADGELTGEGGVGTRTDTELIDMKDALVSFLKTTCARYYEAGERLHDTARDYFGVEADNEKIVKELEKELEIEIEVGLDGGSRDPDLGGGSVGEHVKESNRDEIEDADSLDTPYAHG